MVRALYGLKITGAAFFNHYTDYMHHFGFLPCPSDLYPCMNPMVGPEYGFDYYAYVIIYVDNVMAIHHDAESLLWQIDKYLNLKPSSIGDPDIYLVDRLKNMRPENRVWSWANSPSTYVNESVANAENYLAELSDAR